MQDFLSKARPMRSVLRRTRGRSELPSPVFYVEWLSGEHRRRVLDTHGAAHLLSDNVVQSHYKLVTGAQAKELIASHWAAQAAAAAEAAAAGRSSAAAEAGAASPATARP